MRVDMYKVVKLVDAYEKHHKEVEALASAEGSADD
jgi:hypothetical protein